MYYNRTDQSIKDSSKRKYKLTKDNTIINQYDWETIYKELNTNGIDNLQNLPAGMLEQMNNMLNRPLGPISGDSQIDRNWLNNTTVEEVVNKARKEQGIYNDITLKEPPKQSTLLEVFQQSHENNKPARTEPLDKKEQPIRVSTEEYQSVPRQSNASTQVNTLPKTAAEITFENEQLNKLHERLPEIKAQEAELKAKQEAEVLAQQQQRIQTNADIKSKRDDVLKAVEDRKNQAINYVDPKELEAKAYEEAIKKGEIYASHKEALVMNEQFNNKKAYEEAARKGEIYASHKEAIHMNKQFDNDVMHKEALVMNKQFDIDKAEKAKHWEALKEKTSDARFDIESNVQIAEEALADEIRRNVDSSIIDDAKIDLAYANQDRDNFYNERGYSVQEEQWRKNNPEAAKKLDTKRAAKEEQWRKNNPEAANALDASRSTEVKAKWESRKNASGYSNEAAEKALKNELEEKAAKNLQKSTMKNFGHIINTGVAIMDYKDSREAGNSVGKSVAKAGIEFAKGEIFGGWYMGAMLAKSAPTMIMSTAQSVNTMSRSMNSLQRRQVFGDSQFQDTQQLATMRQSGMELAKMSQYNLQQSLMGNEAEYMHRL